MLHDPSAWTRRRLLRGGLAVGGLGLLSGCNLGRFSAAQRSDVRRIGYLTGGPPSSVIGPAFEQGLRDLGYVEGQNILIDWRNADDDTRLAEPAADLIRAGAEVVVVPSSTVARVVRAASTTIPIVSSGNGDLLSTGLVASLAQPGGNVTGLSTSSLTGKQLQLLQETAPTLSRVAVLLDATTFEVGQSSLTPHETVAASLGLTLQFVEARSADDLEPGIQAALREHVNGLFVLQGPVIQANHDRIGDLAVRGRLPSMWRNTEAIERGGLMGYGPNRADMARRTAVYVDKILKGAKPGDVPVEQPTVFDFVVNLKTAQALGITIPQSILQQATEVIQ